MKESGGITPLRTILQNCLNHIENLETNRSVSDNYDKEFQDLKQFSETLKSQKEFACTEGEKEVNRKKNRYKDILPFNVSRVILSEYAGIPGSDYINANFIKGASGSPAYIASQGPLPNTVNDFWRMVVECEVQVIVMACNAQESGKHKCENYWVEKEGEEKRFGMVQICLVKASTVCPDFLVRTMRLKYTNDKDVTEERTVCQFHYSAWPDHGVPPLVRPLLDMVRLVRDTQASETLPVLVHCSAGCGRTGTICAIDFVWGLLRAGKLTEEFSLFNLVRDMRKQRVAMVQTKEQYILVHQAVRELFKEQLRVIESHPYENIDFNGVPLIKDFEEPFYDTICIQKEENCDEKQDKSEMKEKGEDGDRLSKPDAAPPLPRKKRPNVLFSKQEKEAENLTEKNRASFAEKEREKEKTDASLSNLLGKPRIVKLRALFEKSPTTKERTSVKDRGSQTVSRSHSLGAIRKPLAIEVLETHNEKNKPSSSSLQSTPDSFKLKHSKSFSKSVPLIKRSKSLKTFSHLSVSSQNTANLKVVTNYQSKPCETEIHASSGQESSWEMQQTSELAKDHSKRRRSLESLMGDVPPSITWPTVVMVVDKSGINVKDRQKLLDWTYKQNCSIAQGNNATDLLKYQLQRLSVETEKKMNTFATGIGIRERRNSFRQAVSKSDLQNVLKDYREQHLVGKKPLGSETHWCGSKNIKHTNEVLQLADPSDGVIYLERNLSGDMKHLKTKSAFNEKKYKISENISIEPVKKANGRHPPQQNSLETATNQISGEIRAPKSKMTSKPSRAYEDLERSGDPKNIFLKKLNSEMLSERERESVKNETRTRSNHEEIEKPLVSRLLSGPGSGHSDLKKTLFKSNSSVKPGGSYSVKVEEFDELDGQNTRFDRPPEVNNEKVFQPPIWQNFQGHQTNVKPQKAPKPFECYKCNKAPSHTLSYSRSNTLQKNINYKNSVSESTGNSRRDDFFQDARHKEQLFSTSHKMNVSCVAPSKAHSSLENEGTFGTYRRNSNSDLYLTVSSEFENDEKVLMLTPKISNSEKINKNYDCLPWSHSVSQRSSGDISSSDSKSESLRLLGQSENSNKSEVKIIKKTDQGKGINMKPRSSDSNKTTLKCEQSSVLTKQKRSQDLNPEFRTYGVVAASKFRQNLLKYSKDDFLLEEPTAPPRVKRHASVTVPKIAMNGSDRTSVWISTENKLASGRNAGQAENSNWSESFGIDLDAVAARMQQEKKEPTTLKEATWSGKNSFSTFTNSNAKKKQHYF